jgi:L-threonylcarbamoyladenylate synthase
VTAGSELVALRVPAHPLTRALLAELPFPLAAPSANPFGYISPTTAQHVAQQLGERIPYILDGGPCEVGVESTIVGFPEGQPTVFRKGGLSIESIEKEIGLIRVMDHSSSNPQAPGMLKSHYAPHTPFILGDLDELLPTYQGQKTGILAFRHLRKELPLAQQEILSPSGSFAEAARRLFAAMRALDARGYELILAELLPEEDLGRAINDRLRRAAAKG